MYFGGHMSSETNEGVTGTNGTVGPVTPIGVSTEDAPPTYTKRTLRVVTPKPSEAATSFHFPPPGTPTPQPALGTSTDSVLCEWSVRLPSNDPRLPAVMLVIEQLRGILSGRLALGSMDQAARHGRPAQCHPSKGKAVKRRFGTARFLTSDPAVSTSWDFESMIDLAAGMGAAYNALVHKYLDVCNAQGVNPDDHAGVSFQYKGHSIHLRTR